MSCKQLVTLSACTVLLVLLLNNVSYIRADDGGEAIVDEAENEAKSYFGYQPKPKDSYKKLVEDVHEFKALYDIEWDRLFAKIDAVHKKLYYHKDKDYHGYGYGKMQQMQQLLSEQKATIDALRSDRISASEV